MKTKIISLIAILTITIFTSCKKEEDKDFNYPMTMVYGTWKGTHIKIDGNWRDLWILPSKYQFSVEFNSDGTYYGSGYFGYGSGTYKAYSNTIVTYVKGDEYARYVVKNMNSTNAELTMYMGNENIDIKVQKR